MKNAVYAQSGGVTSVINASAYGTLVAALESKEIDRVFAGINGVKGILNEDLYDLTEEARSEIDRIPYTPGAVFGSCRTKIDSDEDFEKLFKVFDAHSIRYFFYNGGNDSMDTAHKISKKAKEIGYELQVVGIPKTVDNDLLETDHCPGYGSAARFTAISIMEATRDLKSMYSDSTKVFIMESMGRNSGWLAASGSLASTDRFHGPQIILLPEVPFMEDSFIAKVEEVVKKEGYCSIVASEALKRPDGSFISTAGYYDAFGNVQLGKIGQYLEKIIRDALKCKVHVALPDYLQRSSRHVASLIDWQEAVEVGALAVREAIRGESEVMISINRLRSKPYLKEYTTVALELIANGTKDLPVEFISEDGFYVTDEFRSYALPLIQGEAPNLYLNGLPMYENLQKIRARKLL
ncbi:MAG: ATP-dependent phosphofructokinase / diphosphate-dependent phosphofructokinase [Mesotoga sp.]|jgi:6-phosphofructokinase 1|nr:ATP-dependent phosphofructokinase / diphosphate-dependent phosphofructokinase [Mesotoga sp.]